MIQLKKKIILGASVELFCRLSNAANAGSLVWRRDTGPVPSKAKLMPGIFQCVNHIHFFKNYKELGGEEFSGTIWF